MTNHEAIVRMGPKAMEAFLDQVYVAGLNNGMYAQRQNDDSILDDNPFDANWLLAPAEKATAEGADEDGDEYMLQAMVEAVFRNAGIPLDDTESVDP